MDAASLKDAGTGSPLLRLSPFLSAGEEGGWGEGEGGPHPQPRSRAAGGPHPQPRSRAGGEG